MPLIGGGYFLIDLGLTYSAGCYFFQLFVLFLSPFVCAASPAHIQSALLSKTIRHLLFNNCHFLLLHPASLPACQQQQQQQQQCHHHREMDEWDHASTLMEQLVVGWVRRSEVEVAQPGIEPTILCVLSPEPQFANSSHDDPSFKSRGEQSLLPSFLVSSFLLHHPLLLWHSHVVMLFGHDSHDYSASETDHSCCCAVLKNHLIW